MHVPLSGNIVRRKRQLNKCYLLFSRKQGRCGACVCLERRPCIEEWWHKARKSSTKERVRYPIRGKLRASTPPGQHHERTLWFCSPFGIINRCKNTSLMHSLTPLANRKTSNAACCATCLLPVDHFYLGGPIYFNDTPLSLPLSLCLAHRRGRHATSRSPLLPGLARSSTDIQTVRESWFCRRNSPSPSRPNAASRISTRCVYIYVLTQVRCCRC